MPAAEVEVSADLVRRLLADQHPDLVPLPVKFLDRDAVLRVWDAVLAAPGYGGPPVWLHGDLHPANVLVNDGQVSGVIDFGDITAGDPASDLSVAWMLLPLGCHDSFWSAYQAAGGAGGLVGGALRTRATGWALNLAIVFLAHSEDNPVLLGVGRRTLSTVLEDQRGPVG
ncbi:MAG TPA: phosphotransferase [Streptosporangiaceae bacterium]|nr:phosphotransferase [Streptosporangiaceae bacterium]